MTQASKGPLVSRDAARAINRIAHVRGRAEAERQRAILLKEAAERLLKGSPEALDRWLDKLTKGSTG